MFLVAIVLSFALVLLANLYAGLSPGQIIDIPSFIVVVPIPFLLGYAMNRKEFGNAFKNAFSGGEFTEAQKKSHSKMFRLMGKIGIGMGWIGVMIGAIAMLMNMGTGATLKDWGIGIAADLITIYYGYIFNYLFCLPASAKVME